MAPTTATPAAVPSVPTAGADPAIIAKGYVHPEVLVTTAWVADHLKDPKVRILESDEDVLLYDTGHIPGAQKIDWHPDLNDRGHPRLPHAARRSRRCSAGSASTTATTVVFYGDKNNWWAAYAFWVFKLFGFTNMRLVDGGRSKWEAEGRPTSYRRAAVSERRSTSRRSGRTSTIRAFFADVKTPSTRASSSTCGRRRSSRARSSTCPTIRRKARCAVAISRGAKSVPWARAANPDGTFKSADGSRGDLREGAGAQAHGRRHRLLPDRRAVVAHVVRADVSARVSQSPELRRELDRVGECGPVPIAKGA